MVSPEQSNPSSGLAPPHLYRTPITECAAFTATAAPEAGGGDGGGGGGDGGGPPPPPGSLSWLGCERIFATAGFDSSFWSLATSACWAAMALSI